MNLQIFASQDEVLRQLAAHFVGAAQAAIAARGRFSVALSGGSSPRKLYELLASAAFNQQLDWHKADFFFGDERYVPATSPESNYLMAKTALFEPLGIEPTHIFAIDTTLPPPQAAQAYTDAIRRYFAHEPARFDLVLLGLGDNAHTASLFPHTDVLPVTVAEVRAVFLDEQQVYRLTLTAPLINQARDVAFLVYGADKAAAVQRVLEAPRDVATLPAQLIAPAEGQLSWFLDRAAASALTLGS